MTQFTNNKVLELTKKCRVKPNKLLGQNFLRDKNVLNKIIAAANLTKDDLALEVGPGLGVLTRALARQAGRVVAVEKDKALVKILKEKFRAIPNVKIVEGDVLKINIPNILRCHSKFREESRGCEATRATEQSDSSPTVQNDNRSDYKIVANIPYYLTSRLIRLFLESANPPLLMVLMLQKEVAERICAQPPQMSLLAVSVQFYADAKIIASVSKKSFWPQPKVDSAIIRITPRPKINNACHPDPAVAGKGSPRLGRGRAFARDSSSRQGGTQNDKIKGIKPQSPAAAGDSKKEYPNRSPAFAGRGIFHNTLVFCLRSDDMPAGASSSLVKIENEHFFRVVKAGFSQPRKQLINNLSQGLKIDRAQIDAVLKKIGLKPEQRAETLSVEDWVKLAKLV